MQVENTEINGFLIDNFNQYDLKEGKTQGTCPLCSSERKPENRKKQCASYDWERGLGTCHNCNQTFQLHTYKRKGNASKEYIKPDSSPQVVQYNSELSDNVLKWFEERGISQKTLNLRKRLGLYKNLFKAVCKTIREYNFNVRRKFPIQWNFVLNVS